MYNQQPQMLWALTNLGAVNYLTMQKLLVQQQQSISYLIAEVNKLKQLSSPTQKAALPYKQ